MANILVFSELPEVVIANNTFLCDIPIRYKDDPMLEMVREVTGISPRLPIYRDGELLAMAKPRGLFLTAKGKGAGLRMRRQPGLWVCEMNKKPLFQFCYDGAGPLKINAEMQTYDGVFLKYSPESISSLIQPITGVVDGKTVQGAQIGNLRMFGCHLRSVVGIQIGPTTRPLPAAIGIPLLQTLENEQRMGK